MNLIERILPKKAPPEYMESVREMVWDPRVIRAIEKFPREKLAPFYADMVDKYFLDNFDSLEDGFRADDAVILNIFGCSISQPATVGVALSAAQITPKDKIREVGSGSGYLLALASQLGRDVYGVEIEEKLVERSQKALRQLGVKNAYVLNRDGGVGFDTESVFDVIIVSAGVYKTVPAVLEGQLTEGGRIVAFTGADKNLLSLTRGVKVNSQVIYEDLMGRQKFSFFGLKGTHDFMSEKIKAWHIKREKESPRTPAPI